MKLLKVQGAPLVRDMNSNALISCDSGGLQEYQKKRRLMELQKNEMNSIKNEIDELKTDMSEIKNLLVKLLETK